MVMERKVFLTPPHVRTLAVLVDPLVHVDSGCNLSATFSRSREGATTKSFRPELDNRLKVGNILK